MDLRSKVGTAFLIASLCLLLGIGKLEAVPIIPPPGGVSTYTLNITLFSYSTNRLIKGNLDGTVTGTGLYTGTYCYDWLIVRQDKLCVYYSDQEEWKLGCYIFYCPSYILRWHPNTHWGGLNSIPFFPMADTEAFFYTQVTHHQNLPYTEVRFRSVADHTRFLVFTSQGIRLEVPQNDNHIFRSSTQVIPLQRHLARSFYHIDSNSQPCYIAFNNDGSQWPDLCSNPPDSLRLIGINYFPGDNSLD